MTDKNPTAFMSYSWDNDAHTEWVRDLAARLRYDGVDVILDQWHTVPGDQLPEFMEEAIRENDYVLIVCTPNYRVKSDERKGGVGYEGDIITAELLTNRDNRKFIPILRGSDWHSSASSWLKGKYYISLNSSPYSEDQYDDLLATIHRTRDTAPPIGSPPRPKAKSPIGGGTAHDHGCADPAKPIRITGVLADEVSTPRMDGTPGSALYAVPFQLSRTPSHEWSDAFVATWNHPPRLSTMHCPGTARVSGDRIILDGTTIEDVHDVHRETLILCVDKANEIIEEHEAKKRRAQEVEAKRKGDHQKNVRDIANRIDF